MEIHSNQLVVSPALVSRLVSAQFPEWANLPVESVPGQGTVNAIFRIGSSLTARFPLQKSPLAVARGAMEAESAAAIEFADVAGCPTPAPVAIGAPGLGYPMPWLLQTWIPGRIASARGAENGDALALDIAALVQRLRSVDTRGRAFSGHGRGDALAAHDEWIERCLLESAGLLDTKRARVMWEWFRE